MQVGLLEYKVYLINVFKESLFLAKSNREDSQKPTTHQVRRRSEDDKLPITIADTDFLSQKRRGSQYSLRQDGPEVHIIGQDRHCRMKSSIWRPVAVVYSADPDHDVERTSMCRLPPTVPIIYLSIVMVL